MRMKELVAASGVSRSSIHYYLREGLVPPPQKTGKNAALYDHRHLERLRLIGRLRSESFGIERIRRILEQVEEGVPLDLAVTLQRAVTMEGGEGEGRMSLQELAERAEITQAQARKLLKVGLLTPAPRRKGGLRFDRYDLEVARRFCRLSEETGLSVEDVEPICRGIAEVSRLEMEQADRAIAGASAARRAQVSLEMQEMGELMHRYLFSRHREHQIEQRAGQPPRADAPPEVGRASSKEKRS